MKSASVKGSSRISVTDVEPPKIGDGDILVKMEACGICGSDVEKVFGKYGQSSMRLGHEPAGIVTSVGSKVKGFAIGDRVFTHHHVPCYSCHFCKHGNETMCTKYNETNLSPCGLSEEYLVPAWNIAHGGVLKIPDSMSFEEAAMIEPLGCCVRVWNKLDYHENDSVAIFGVGPTGMMHVMLARSYNLKPIFCIDVNEYRLNFTSKFNVDAAIHSNNQDKKKIIQEATQYRGVDIAIIATGNLQALNDAIDLVRKGGSIMMFGVPSRGDSVNLDMSKIYSKEISLHTSYAASDHDTKEALKLIESSTIDVNKLITHKYSIIDSQKAFDHAHSGKNAMKIIITK